MAFRAVETDPTDIGEVLSCLEEMELVLQEGVVQGAGKGRAEGEEGLGEREEPRLVLGRGVAGGGTPQEPSTNDVGGVGEHPEAR